MTIEAKLDETNLLLRELIALTNSKQSPTPATATPAPTKPKAEKTKEKPAEKPADPTPPADEGPSLFDDEPAPVVEAKPLTKEDIRNALVAYQTAKDKNAALALLKKYDAISTGTLKPEKAPGLVAEVRTFFGDKFDAAIAAAILAQKKA